jgi:hypothetical protein
MADTKDELEARRWFRQRLAEIGTQYPHLKRPESRERLTEALDHHHTEEMSPCPDNPPADPQDGP